MTEELYPFPYDLDETFAEAEQESATPWWAPVGLALCLLVGSWVDQRGAEIEAEKISPITYVTVPDVKYRVHYSSNEGAVVFREYVPGPEDWNW